MRLKDSQHWGRSVTDDEGSENRIVTEITPQPLGNALPESVEPIGIGSTQKKQGIKTIGPKRPSKERARSLCGSCEISVKPEKRRRKLSKSKAQELCLTCKVPLEWQEAIIKLVENDRPAWTVIAGSGISRDAGSKYFCSTTSIKAALTGT